MKKFKILLSLSVLFSLFLTPAMVSAAVYVTGADMGTGKYYVYDGNSFTDDTTDANSMATADVLWPAMGNSTIYFGSNSKFEQIYFKISSTEKSSAWASSIGNNFEYYNGAGWQNLDVYNYTGAFVGTGVHTLNFVSPVDWATYDPADDGSNMYFARWSCDVNCFNMMEATVFDQISLHSVTEGGPQMSNPSPAPEFSTYALIVTLGIAGASVLKKAGSFGRTQA